MAYVKGSNFQLMGWWAANIHLSEMEPNYMGWSSHYKNIGKRWDLQFWKNKNSKQKWKSVVSISCQSQPKNIT